MPVRESQVQKSINWEAVGLTLVLFAAGCQVFIEGHLQASLVESTAYDMEVKLDSIWLQIGALQDQVGGSEEHSGTAIPFRDAAENWEWAGEHSDLLSSQVSWSTIIRGLIFVAGSFAIICSKRLLIVTGDVV